MATPKLYFFWKCANDNPKLDELLAAWLCSSKACRPPFLFFARFLLLALTLVLVGSTLAVIDAAGGCWGGGTPAFGLETDLRFALRLDDDSGKGNWMVVLLQQCSHVMTLAGPVRVLDVSGRWLV
jgi:hypothetical protein